jgi:hypothetical protein
VEFEDALRQAMLENDLDEVYERTIRNLHARTDDAWRECCGSSCDPCMLQFGRVVDRLRKLIQPPTT